MKKFFTALLIVYSLFLTACPKDSAVRKAAKASFELSGITVDVINATSKGIRRRDHRSRRKGQTRRG
jgi:hypothetical protein